MTKQDRAHRPRQINWLVAAILSAVCLLATSGVALGAPQRGASDGALVHGQSWLPGPAVSQQPDATIPMFVNPSRRVLYPGEQVLVSVGDDWLRANLTWDTIWSSGNPFDAGVLSAVRGPYVQYTAPYVGGYVQVVVRGTAAGRSGVGFVEFYVQR
jgi:hypothetical protein